MDAVQARLGDAADQSGEQGAGGGHAHVLLLVPHGQDQHAGGGSEAGEVPGAHGALDEVEAVLLDVEQHDGVDRPVQAQRHHEGVGQRDEKAEDEGADVVDRQQDLGQARAHVHADRAQDEARERNHDEHGDEGHEDELDVGGDDLLQPLRQRAEHRCHEQGREDLGVVVEDRQRQVTEEGDLRDLRAQEGDLVGRISQAQRGKARQHGEAHDRETDPRVRPQLLGGVVGDHEGQEVEHCPPGQVEVGPGGLQGDT